MDGDDLNGQGYPTLIHKLTYRRTKHHNMHVRGDKVEGTTTTPVDMVVFKDFIWPKTWPTGCRVWARVAGRASRSFGTSQAITNAASGNTAKTCPRSAIGSGERRRRES